MRVQPAVGAESVPEVNSKRVVGAGGRDVLPIPGSRVVDWEADGGKVSGGGYWAAGRYGFGAKGTSVRE